MYLMYNYVYTLRLYLNVAHIISRFPQPYLFAGHTAESLFMVTVLCFAWKNFVSSKISKNFIALCTTYISLTYLENQTVTGLFLKGSIQWQLKTLVFKTLVLSHIRLNSIVSQFSKIEIKVTSSTVSIVLC